jgi:hypothetical protein
MAPDSGAFMPEGNALYCCIYVPHCENDGRCDNANTAEAVSFLCNDPLVPQGTDPSLECATIFSGEGATSYCCTHQIGCFPIDVFGCGDAGQSYVCTGDASPNQYGLACGAGIYADAGTQGTYCCESDAWTD